MLVTCVFLSQWIPHWWCHMTRIVSRRLDTWLSADCSSFTDFLVIGGSCTTTCSSSLLRLLIWYSLRSNFATARRLLKSASHQIVEILSLIKIASLSLATLAPDNATAHNIKLTSLGCSDHSRWLTNRSKLAIISMFIMILVETLMTTLDAIILRVKSTCIDSVRVSVAQRSTWVQAFKRFLLSVDWLVWRFDSSTQTQYLTQSVSRPCYVWCRRSSFIRARLNVFIVCIIVHFLMLCSWSRPRCSWDATLI